ncbi:MAG: hypothetical protein KA155_04335 [Alphaproteobacteria bacterium]|jgi:hypothetical protein|nr:hypothetical protein [Alphaproteobacteria bacterium]
MSLSFLAPNRTVMLVSDEAAYIYSTSARGVRLVETVPWEAENFEGNVAGILKKDCGNKPVLILNDMVEQHYRKEKVLKAGVSVMDKSGMLRRKLNVAFPNYPVKAAYPLKEKPPKSERKIPADIYIFAAVPDTKQLALTIGATSKSLVPVSGFCLLPVESSDMVQTLSAKLTKKGEPKCRWVLFIGQHKNGSLRQIVTKNGELALTRMTPIVESDNDVEAWANEVHQEFKATMSYLTRFGFQSEDGLHVIVMANESAGEAIEAKIEEPCKYTALTSSEAARVLNVALGSQDDFRYADPLHAAWVGRKAKFILPMRAAQIDNVSKPRKTAMAASVVLILGLGVLGYQMLSQIASMATLSGDIDESRSRLSMLSVQYEKEVQRKEELGFDVRLVQSSIAVQDALEKVNIKPLSLFQNIGRALGRDLRFDRVIMTRPADNLVNSLIDAATPQTSPPVFEVTLQMTYPSTTNIDKGNKEVNDLKGRLQSLLPDHTVEVTKLLKDYEYVEEIVVETGDLEKKDVSQDFVAEIKIKGPPLEPVAEVSQ